MYRRRSPRSSHWSGEVWRGAASTKRKCPAPEPGPPVICIDVVYCNLNWVESLTAWLPTMPHAPANCRCQRGSHSFGLGLVNPCVNFNSTLVQEEPKVNPITLNDYPHEVLVISQLRVCNRRSASMFFMITFTAGVSILRIDGLQTNIASYVCTLSWTALGWSFFKVFQGDSVRLGDIVHAQSEPALLGSAYNKSLKNRPVSQLC